MVRFESEKRLAEFVNSRSEDAFRQVDKAGFLASEFAE